MHVAAHLIGVCVSYSPEEIATSNPLKLYYTPVTYITRVCVQIIVITCGIIIIATWAWVKFWFTAAVVVWYGLDQMCCC